MDDQIYRRIIPQSPWIGLVRRGEFPEGMGETISNLTYERTAPTDAVPTWTDVVSSTDDQGCLPVAATIGFASTVRTFNLQKRAVNGPDFCAESLRTPFAMSKQLEAITETMGGYAQLEWEIRNRSEYIRLAGRKVVVGATLTEGTAATFPGVAATSILTQGVLNRYKPLLRRDGSLSSSLGKLNGSPILTLMVSMETGDDLIFRNAEIRQDIRWGKPSELLSSYGVEREYRGFYHMIDDFPKRYTFAGGVYTEVPAWTTAAATNGTKAILNPAWLAAPYEATEIFDPMVMKSLIPKPVTSPGGMFKFNPVNYMGQFSLRNIPNKECNPDENIVFPRAIFASGSEPIYPDRGVAFIHLRCDAAIGAVLSCS